MAMALKNRKIRLKFRGTRVNGKGKKGSRKKGHAGGKGNAGSFRHKKIWFILNNPEHLKKKGMPGSKKKVRYTNLDWINEKAKDGLKEIDITKYGYERLLGRGKIEFPIKVIVKSVSNKAKQKIESAGGSVELM